MRPVMGAITQSTVASTQSEIAAETATNCQLESQRKLRKARWQPENGRRRGGGYR